MQTYIKGSYYEKGNYREVFDCEATGDDAQVYIKSNLKIYAVTPVGRLCVEREEFCATKLEFTVLKDEVLSFNQGDAVSMKYKGDCVFFGYVFTKKRDKECLIKVVCYDQMRYMKNRRTYTRGSMRLDEIVSRLAEDYRLRKGKIDKCGTILAPYAAQSVSLLDVVKKACRDVRDKTGERYILFDNGGELFLKNESNMLLNVVIDASQAENYDYTDTIDSGVYNMVEVYSDKKRYNTRTVGVASDKETMDRWGTLILSKKAVEVGEEKKEAENLLKEYNRVNREIVIKKVPGRIEFFPGSRVYVRLEMGDLNIEGYVRVKKAVHIFENNAYLCNLYLDGSELE